MFFLQAQQIGKAPDTKIFRRTSSLYFDRLTPYAGWYVRVGPGYTFSVEMENFDLGSYRSGSHNTA